jgi:hypothetical protein
MPSGLLGSVLPIPPRGPSPICRSLRGVPHSSRPVQKAQNAMPHDQGALMAWDKKEEAQGPHGSRDKRNSRLLINKKLFKGVLGLLSFSPWCVLLGALLGAAAPLLPMRPAQGRVGVESYVIGSRCTGDFHQIASALPPPPPPTPPHPRSSRRCCRRSVAPNFPLWAQAAGGTGLGPGGREGRRP